MTPTECTAGSSLTSRPAAAQDARIGQLLYWLGLATASSILISIAVSQILLGISLLVLLISKRRLEFPPIALPISLFFACTIFSDLLSGDPRSGIPQIRKFFVFAIVLVLFNAFRSVAQVQNLICAWSAIATLSGVVAIGQFLHRWREAVRLHASLYDYVLDGRLTGFASHWMTYGGEQMIAILMLLALLAFSPRSPWKALGWTAAAIIWIGIVLGLTRSIFLAGVPSGAALLAWNYKRWLFWTAPFVGIGLLLASPAEIRERVFSVFRPHGDVDSNSRRAIMARTGLRMIAAHPWFGIGPEQVQPQFLRYLPPDVPTPLPKGWYGHLHNIYLQYAAERGIPGLACILWLIAKVGADIRRALCRWPKQPGAGAVYLGALAVIVAVLAEGFFEYNLGDSEVLTMFLAAVTCCYVAMRPDERIPS